MSRFTHGYPLPTVKVNKYIVKVEILVIILFLLNFCIVHYHKSAWDFVHIHRQLKPAMQRLGHRKTYCISSTYIMQYNYADKGLFHQKYTLITGYLLSFTLKHQTYVIKIKFIKNQVKNKDKIIHNLHCC